jgi:hypothetical protein
MVSPRYFVLHLAESQRPAPDLAFQIQQLDKLGATIESVFISESQVEAEIAGVKVPRTVLDAARRQPMGQGDYVDECGRPVRPF